MCSVFNAQLQPDGMKIKGNVLVVRMEHIMMLTLEDASDRLVMEQITPMVQTLQLNALMDMSLIVPATNVKDAHHFLLMRLMEFVSNAHQTLIMYLDRILAFNVLLGQFMNQSQVTAYQLL